MYLQSYRLKNFRRLKNAHIELAPKKTIFVGANNSGKTSAAQALQLFLGPHRDRFSIYDFSSDCWGEFSRIGEAGMGNLPKITLDLWFSVAENDLHRVMQILPALDWEGSLLGVRLEYGPKDAIKLFEGYKATKSKSEETKAASQNPGDFTPWPRSLTDYLSKQLAKEYQTTCYLLDRSQFDADFNEQGNYFPQELRDENNKDGRNILESLVRMDFLDAQRHLSDSTRSEELSKRLSRFYSRNFEKRDHTYETLKALSDSESQLDAHLAKVFEPTLKSLEELGYPGVANPRLIIKSALDPKNIMTDNTRVHYSLPQTAAVPAAMTLPDKYNGLGFKNLIYMVVEVLDFHARWMEDDESRALLHLIVVEEPEAHLHVQLQQVFIGKILSILEKNNPDAESYTNQLVVTTHSPHIIYECGFKPIRYFRRSILGEDNHTSEAMNLSRFYQSTEPDIRSFLQRYMKLTHCDLFFADAAILVEGNVERLLLPKMIEKVAKDLQASYVSVLEVGGAFAHKFKELLEFLGLPALVVTDLDSVFPSENDEAEASGDTQEENAQETEVDDENEESGSCYVHTPDAETSNQTLVKWIPQLKKISELLEAEVDQKIQNPNDRTPATIRIAYQAKQNVTWGETTASIAGRTFEESFALENLEWSQNIANKKLRLRVVNNSGTFTIEQIAQKLFKRVSGKNFNKTDFALNLLAEQTGAWVVPKYIAEGLEWLNIKLKAVNPSLILQDTDLVNNDPQD